MLQEDFLNEKKISKIESVQKTEKEMNFNKSSGNFNVNKIEINEEQIDFIKNNLMNHFIFKDMSSDIM